MTLEEKLFQLHDDLTHRIRACCGKLDWTPVSGSCGTCRIDGQLRGMLSRYIDAGKMKRPAGMEPPARLEIVNPLPYERPSSGSGLPPLTEEAKIDFRRKLRGATAAIAGGRR
jgi:hypothetical protein